MSSSVCKLTKKKHLIISQDLIKEIGLKTGDKAYLLPIIDPGIEILTYGILKDQSFLVVNTKGKLYIASGTLRNNGLEGDKFKVSLSENRNSIKIEKA